MERGQQRGPRFEQVLDAVALDGMLVPLDHVEHHVDRANGMLADGRFGRQDQAVGAVEERVDDVVELGAGRLAIDDHRLE